MLKIIVNSIEYETTEVPKVTFGLTINNKDTLRIRVYINYRKLLNRRKYDHANLQKELEALLSSEGVWVGMAGDGIMTLS